MDNSHPRPNIILKYTLKHKFVYQVQRLVSNYRSWYFCCLHSKSVPIKLLAPKTFWKWCSLQILEETQKLRLAGGPCVFWSRECFEKNARAPYISRLLSLNNFSGCIEGGVRWPEEGVVDNHPLLPAKQLSRAYDGIVVIWKCYCQIHQPFNTWEKHIRFN